MVIQLPIALELSDQFSTPNEAIAAFGVIFTVLSYAYPDSVGVPGVDIIYFFFIYGVHIIGLPLKSVFIDTLKLPDPLPTGDPIAQIVIGKSFPVY
jgi:hypothetical protein